MDPKNVPVAVAEQSNRTSLAVQPKNVPAAASRKKNVSDALKKGRPVLASGKKRGVKPGSIIKTGKTHEDWYLACEAYRTLASQGIKMKRSSFLQSGHCAACFTGTKSEEQSLGRWLVKFDNGQLEASGVMRGRSRKYVEIEKKLIQYLDLRAQKYAQDKCGVRWIFIEKICLKFAEGLGLTDFKASPSWISATLKRNKKVGINLPGKANDMTNEEREVIMSAWRKDFQTKIVEVDINAEVDEAIQLLENATSSNEIDNVLIDDDDKRKDILPINQNVPVPSFLDAESSIAVLRNYCEGSKVPTETRFLLDQFAQQIRAHRLSNPKASPTTDSFV